MANLFDTDNVPTTEPATIVVGDLLQWKRTDLGTDYANGNKQVRLLYVLQPSAKITKRFRFYEDAERITRAVSPKLFRKNFSHAIRTARRSA